MQTSRVVVGLGKLVDATPAFLCREGLRESVTGWVQQSNPDQEV